MELFQKQATQAKDRFLKKQIDFRVLATLFSVIFFSNTLVGEDINIKIDKYLRGLNSFSSSFVQSDTTSLEEGLIYIKDGMIRLDYSSPDRTLKIKKDKGVYINHELEEEEFFSTKNNTVRAFYDIFLNKSFFYSLSPKINKKEIVFEKNITIDSDSAHITIIFENNPLVLRKIIAKTESNLVSINFYDHVYNEIFDNDFFSFVPIYND